MTRTRSALLAAGLIAGAGFVGAQEPQSPQPPASLPSDSASAPAIALGSLGITAEPGTTIYWDGVEIGVTDENGRMTISGAPPGRYTLTARRAGFEDLEHPIEVEAGTQTVDLVLVESPTTQPAATLPDPFARRKSTFGVLLPSVILLFVAGGVLLLMRRRHEPVEEGSIEEVDGPHLAFKPDRSNPRRPPGFYEDLRQREATLESFEEGVAGRPAPKVIELPVADRRRPEDDS